MSGLTGDSGNLVILTVIMRNDYGLISDIAIFNRNRSKNVTGVMLILLKRNVKHLNIYG